MAITDNCVMALKLDDTYLDSTVNINDAVNTGTSFVAGKINNGIVLDGTSDYLTVPTSVFQFGTSDATIIFWIKRSATQSAYQTVSQLHESTGGNPGSWLVRFEPDNRIRFLVDGGASVNSVYTSGTITDQLWHMVTVQRDYGVAVRISIDAGTFATSGDSSFNINGNESPRIGLKNSNNEGFPGCIDEYTVWHRNLTQLEINQVYNSGTGIQYPFEATGYSNKINGITSYVKINGIDVANISKVNGV